MELSQTERWILSNQYRILELLDKTEAKSHREAQEALNRGFEFYYDALSEHIYPPKDTLSNDDCIFVIDVMSMFFSMQIVYDALQDKSGITPSDVEFFGFDGNHEGKYMAFAEFHCRSQGAFASLRKGFDGYNSHMPTLDIYERMLPVWKQCKNKFKPTKDEVIAITQAAIHPERRKTAGNPH